jgi:glycosyltransferase involved in cell wall biosynthesis
MTHTNSAAPASLDSSLRQVRVCALVINSVTYDSRVLKQADSLARAGYEVTVVGVMDARNAQSTETRPSGATVRRVAWRAPAFRRLGIAQAFLTAVALVSLGLLAHALPYEALGSYLQERYFLPLLAYAALGAIGWQGIRRTKRAFAAARRYRLMESASERPAAAATRRKRIESRLRHAYKTFNWARPIGELVQSIDPHVVHCHDVFTLPIGARIKRKLGCSVVYDAHEIYEDVAQNQPEIRDVFQRLQNRHVPQVDAFITINDSIGEFYTEHYPALPQPTIIKNASIPVAPFVYDGRLHEAAGLPQTQRILLFQGGFAPRRGLEVLVQSSVYLDADWTLVMMGWGSLEEDLRSRADRATQAASAARITPCVSFLPGVEQSELPYWTAGATVGVIPYDNVGLNHWFCSPNKLWEYPNAGVPLLVSPFPELKRVVERYGLGWLLPDPLQPDSIARVLARLDDKDFERACAACKQFIDKDNWLIYEQRLLNVYRGLLGTPDPRGYSISPEALPQTQP